MDKAGKTKPIIARLVSFDPIVIFVFLVVAILATPVASYKFMKTPLFTALGVSFLIGGVTLAIMGLRLLKHPLMSFLRAKTRLFALVAYPDREVLIKPAYWVGKNLIRIGNDYYEVRPEDVFYGPAGTKWVVVGHGSGLANGLSLITYPSEITGIYLKPNMKFMVRTADGKKREVGFYVRPSPEDIKDILKKMEEAGKDALVIHGVSIPIADITKLTDYDYFTEKKAEMKALREEMLRRKKYEDIQQIIKLLIVGAIAAAIIITAIKTQQINPEMIKKIVMSVKSTVHNTTAVGTR